MALPSTSGEVLSPHQILLYKRCRLCGTPFLGSRPGRKELVQATLKSVFNIDIDSDDKHVHPQYVCTIHRARLYKMKTDLDRKGETSTFIVPYSFKPHSNDCLICKDADEKPPVKRYKETNQGKQGSLVVLRSLDDRHNDHQGDDCLSNPERLVKDFFDLNSADQQAVFKKLVLDLSDENKKVLANALGKTRSVRAETRSVKAETQRVKEDTQNVKEETL